jgi:hypothetical protein
MAPRFPDVEPSRVEMIRESGRRGQHHEPHGTPYAVDRAMIGTIDAV